MSAHQNVTVQPNGDGSGTFNTPGISTYIIPPGTTLVNQGTALTTNITFTVPSVAQLRLQSVAGLPAGTYIQSSGYYAPNDGGSAVYVWNSASTAADNGGTVIAPTGVATGRWLMLYSGFLSVKCFGAYGNGVTDDSAAILAAEQAAVAASVVYPQIATIYFPNGIYIVKTVAILSAYGSTATGNTTDGAVGVRFRGEGMFDSVIRAVYSGGGWLWDNATSGTHFQQVQFDNLGFEGLAPASYTGFSSLPANTSFFKMTYSGATYAEQGAIFNNCRFDMFTQDFDFEGPAGNNCSEVKFNGCKIYRTAATVYTLNNNQSVNHNFFSTDIEQAFGDVFSIGPTLSSGSGGGGIAYYGGSIITFSDGTSTNRYFVRTTVYYGGINDYPFVFSGLRMEFHSQYANLFLIPTTSQYNLNFDKCLFLYAPGTSATTFGSLGAYATATFRDCTLDEQSTGQMQFYCSNNATVYGENGTMVFDTCGLPFDFSDRCSTNGSGAVRAINCYGVNAGAVVGQPNHWAFDFDTHWNAASPGLVGTWDNGSGGTITSDGSPVNGMARLKAAYLKLPIDYYTTAGGTIEQTLKLPKNAIIKTILFLKPAATSDSTACIWNVGNLNESVAHLTTASTANNVAINQAVTNYFYQVGSATNDRTLRFYASSGTANGVVQGGFIIVEYY